MKNIDNSHKITAQENFKTEDFKNLELNSSRFDSKNLKIT
jgi:hypothetical protein